MQFTPNYNLKKPEGNEKAKIADLNENFDEIDRAIKEAKDAAENIDLSEIEERVDDVEDELAQHLDEYPLDLGLKANKQQESWQSLPLVNGWGNAGSGFKPLACFKDEFGFVHVKGDISGGVITSNTVVTALPSGYTPLENNYVNAFNSDGSVSLVTSNIIIEINGNIRILNAEHNNHISINASFKVV